MKLAILGAGAWGSALAIAFAARHDVRLWTRSDEHARVLGQERRNQRYLPGVNLPESLRIEHELSIALAEVDLSIAASSTSGFSTVLAALQEQASRAPVLWVCKGFETTSGKLPAEIAAGSLNTERMRGALYGPSFALEVAQGLPTALTLASTDAEFARTTAAALSSGTLRIYSSTDVVGVELGGALKNIIAIAAGICDGLGLGNNARAALITRGLAEMSRLGVAMGGQPETFMGLTGLGDLLLTATGDLSRNRTVGKKLAQGMPLEAILAELGHVAEGVHSARAARARAQRLGIEMPITDAVCAVLFDHLAPKDAVQQLLARDPKPE